MQTIKFTIVDTFTDSYESGQPTFLDSHNPYQGYFSVVIWNSTSGAYGADPQASYNGQTVCVHGTVSSYNNAPEIQVNAPSQIITTTGS